MSIYTIAANYNELIALLDSDEMEEDVLRDTLEAVEGEFEVKAENYAKIMKNFENEIAGMKAEEERLAKRRKIIENNISRMKGMLFEAMKLTGKEKFKTDLFSFTIAKNGGKIPLIVDAKVEELPDELVSISRIPNNEAIRQFVENNPENTFAHFGERGESLRIK